MFIILDKDNDGLVSMSDLKQVFNSKMHPEVMQGKRSSEAVLIEFLETVEDHHILLTGLSSAKEAGVSLEEFLDYYKNVAFFYEKDEMFAIVLSNTWSMSGAY